MSLKRIWPAALAAVAVGLVPATGGATSMSAPPTVADMSGMRPEIVVGTVKDVREVRQGALPVMEVEVAISERIRGGAGAIIAFRQLSPTASKGAPQNGVRFLGTCRACRGTRRASASCSSSSRELRRVPHPHRAAAGKVLPGPAETR